MTLRKLPTILSAVLVLALAANPASSQTAPAGQDVHHPGQDAAPQGSADTSGEPAKPGEPPMQNMMGMMTPQMMQMMHRMMEQGGMPGMMGQGGMPMMNSGGAAPMMPQAMGMMPPRMMDPMMGQGGMPGMGMGMGMGGMPMGGRMGFLSGTAGGETQEMTPQLVRAWLERQLAWLGNSRLKIGTVSAMNDGNIAAEIVTVDGSLVQKLAFNRYPGFVRRLTE